MSDKNKKYTIVVGVVVLIGVFFFVKRKQTATRRLASESSVVAVPEKSNKSKSLSRGSAANDNRSDTAGVIQRQQRMIEAGFTRAPLIIDDKGAHFNVHVKIKKTCTWGDLDLIHAELAANSGGRLLLTLEPLVPGGEFKAIAQPITYANLAAGFDHSFNFPPLKSTVSVGIFLCSDNGQGDSCTGKKVEDINEAYKAVISPRQLDNGKLSAVSKPPFRVYFFQHVLLAPESADIQVGTKFDDSGYKKITSVLTKELGSSGSAQASTQRVRDLNQKVTSIPVASSPSDLSLVLSLKDQAEACPKMMSKPVRMPPIPPKGFEPVRPPGERYYRVPTSVK